MIGALPRPAPSLPSERMTHSSSRRRALVALAVLSLIWSYNWIVMKQALLYAGPFTFSALRYTLGTGVLFAVLLARRASLRPPPLLPTLLIGLAQTTGFQALVQWALVEGGAGRTALLAYTMPFWLMLLAWPLLGERLRAASWAALALAASGLTLILEPWHGLGGGHSAALAIAGGLCWAIGVVLSKRLFARSGVGALSLTAWQMLFGSLGLIAITIGADERAIEWSPWFLAALAYNAVLSSGLAWLLWSYVVERLPASLAGLSSLVIPIAGIGFAWLQLGERPTAVATTGIALIAVALAFATGLLPRPQQIR